MKHRGENVYRPELDEVLEVCGSYKKAVEEGVRQEQHEVFVVGKSHTVVHPVEGTTGTRPRKNRKLLETQ